LQKQALNAPSLSGVAAVSILLIVLLGSAHNLFLSGKTLTASLHPLSAAGYVVLAIALTIPARLRTCRRVLSAVQTGVVAVSIERLLETFVPGWPQLLDAPVFLEWKANLGFAGSFSVETALALTFLHLTLLLERTDRRLSLAALMGAWGISTLSTLQTVFAVLLWHASLSVFSLTCMLIGAVTLTERFKDMALLSPVFSVKSDGLVVRSLLIGALVIPWFAGFLYFQLASVSQADHYILEFIFGLIGWAMMALVLVTGHVMERASKAMAFAATHDYLTGILNRPGLFGQLTESMGQRGVILFDLDHFKTINDSLGHDAGDRVLRDVADLVHENLRPEDLFARWGGEEFLVVLPCADEDALVAAAERLRSGIATRVAVCDGNTHYIVTASFGVAIQKDDETVLDPAIRRADAALYAAKELGRNRISAASDMATRDPRPGSEADPAPRDLGPGPKPLHQSQISPKRR